VNPDTRDGSRVRIPFTVGICASDAAEQLPGLLSSVASERFGDGLVLERIVVVASGCPPSVLSRVKNLAEADPRITLISELGRRGKAEAINRIIQRASGDYLVMLNNDAIPGPGAIQELLEVQDGDSRVGCVSASPVFDVRGGLLQHALGLMWSAHNLMSLTLNHAGISNHACDELIVVRRSLFPELPPDLVNDGAYIGGVIRARGMLVKCSQSAQVKIDVPARIIDLVRQRRRIIFGHVQVWKKLGRPPKTIESMLFADPLLSARTVVRLLSGRPEMLVALPLVAVSELISSFLAIGDVMHSTQIHTVWRRVSGRAN